MASVALHSNSHRLDSKIRLAAQCTSVVRRAQTPLAREQQHARNEREGALRFVPLTNDGRAESLVPLVDLKNIFAKQLPKMPREYIVRLVLDRFHHSLACEFQREVVGGICYRAHPEQSFAEIAFCAVSATHQVQGYGTRLMNQLKEKAKRDGIEYLLTYADNHAIGYFRKQGFQKQAAAPRAPLPALAAARAPRALPPEAGDDEARAGAGDDEARELARVHQRLRGRHADGVRHRPCRRLPLHPLRRRAAARSNGAGADARRRRRLTRRVPTTTAAIARARAHRPAPVWPRRRYPR